MAIKYVRFQRGTQAAYDLLKSKNGLDENTLYFIYSEDNNGTGSLYMGARLISGGDITFTSASLDQLSDVIVEGAETNSFLVKNEEGNWVAKTLEDVIALIQENGGIEGTSSTEVFQVVLVDNETDEEAINRITKDALLNDGDIAVVKDLIANDKYEYTAYVYSNEVWSAMDGNYNATNVYFDTDLTITANIGVQEIDSTGSKTLDTTGKSLKQVLDMIMAARKLPSKTEPKVIVTSDEDNAYEVGTTVTLSYNASLSTGSYTYGPDTGITPSTWSVSFNGETLDTATGTFKPMVVVDNTNLKVTATATYENGAIPVDNLGEEITNTIELNTCQIKAGSKSGTSNSVTGYRNAFAGSAISAIDLTSNNLRNLKATKASNSSLTVTIVEGARQVIIAVPSGRVVTKVADEGAFGTDIFSEFVKSIVSVGGADATADNIGINTKNYNVYVYSPSTALGANTYTVTLANG